SEHVVPVEATLRILLWLYMHFNVVEIPQPFESSIQVLQDCRQLVLFFFFKQKTAYEIGLGIPAEPLFRSPSRSPLPALAIAPETKLGTASSGLGTLEP